MTRNPNGRFIQVDTMERFWSKVLPEPNTGCWLWIGSITSKGYGTFWDGKTVNAHVFSYRNLQREIPSGLQLDHLCRNRHCVNPSHLEPVTCRVNLLRGITSAAVNAAKTHCLYGHVYDEKNTYWGRNGRRCKRCRADGVARLLQKRKCSR